MPPPPFIAVSPWKVHCSTSAFVPVGDAATVPVGDIVIKDCIARVNGRMEVVLIPAPVLAWLNSNVECVGRGSVGVTPVLYIRGSAVEIVGTPPSPKAVL